MNSHCEVQDNKINKKIWYDFHFLEYFYEHFPSKLNQLMFLKGQFTKKAFQKSFARPHVVPHLYDCLSLPKTKNILKNVGNQTFCVSLKKVTGYWKNVSGLTVHVSPANQIMKNKIKPRPHIDLICIFSVSLKHHINDVYRHGDSVQDEWQQH